MSFNYSDFKRFRDQFQNRSQTFEAWIHGFILNEGLRFIRSVKLNTPVDTGDLRNHWTLDKNSLRRVGDELQVWFVNSMNYASFVEYGHAKPYKSGAAPGSTDWVEGYFMMTISLDQIYKSMPARFDKEFIKFMRM